jgi:hypothetical protein
MVSRFHALQDIYGIEDHETIDSRERSGIDPNGVWASVYPIEMGGNKLAWVHLVCAIFSPCTWLKASQWHNLKSEIRRGQCLECSQCKKRGASVGCIFPRCKFIAHVPCALDLGWSPSVLRRQFMCPNHTHKQELADLEIDRAFCYDISKGQEPLPVTMEAPLQLHNQPNQSALIRAEDIKEFYYVSHCVDSHDTSLTSSTMSALSCCQCEGACSEGNCPCHQVEYGYSRNTSCKVLIKPCQFVHAES